MKQFHDAKVFNTRLPSFRYSKNYGSLTHETRIKDAVNMERSHMSFGDRYYNLTLYFSKTVKCYYMNNFSVVSKSEVIIPYFTKYT